MKNWKTLPVKGTPLVSLAIACYLDGPDRERRRHQLTGLAASLAAQTWANWEAVIVHDGTGDGSSLAGEIARYDARLSVWATPERKQQYGHPWRHRAIREHTRGEYVGFANDDAWFAPVFFEALLSRLTTTKARLAHCDLIHSHGLWKLLSTEPRRGRLDVGGWLAARDVVLGTPWTSYEFHGDGLYINALATKLGRARIAKVPNVLYVHN